MPDDSIPRSIQLVALILCGGFFAGSETAFSFCNKIRIKMLADEGDKRAKRVMNILNDFDKTIVTLLIAINVIYVFASSTATVFAVEIMGPAGSVVATVVMTLLIFLFSETIPKNIARTNSDAFALAVSMPISLLRKLLTPFSFILTHIGEFAKKLTHLDEVPAATEDDFTNIVEEAEDKGVIEPEETEIIKSAIEFDDLVAADVMTPAEKIVMIPLETSEDELKTILLREKFSRFPIYCGNRENIIGVIQAQNCLWKLLNGLSFKLSDVMKRPYFVNVGASVRNVFEGMGKARTHFAVVENDEGIIVGILTMEDILEEIVGEIYDEDDTETAGASAEGGAENA